MVETDLSVSTYLTEQTKEIFEQAYKENLYMPKEEDSIRSITFNGKNIELFDANTAFSMIVKRINFTKDNSQEVWNSMTKDINDKKILRYYTSTSYMTAENILNLNDTILGFSQGIKNYSFNGMFSHDARTPFNQGDGVYTDLNSITYMLPSTLETNTNNDYNEIVINTLGMDEQGQMTKMQPDYVVYIKDQEDIESLEGDPVWEKSKKVASEFDIPIVMIDREKVRESEQLKIANMSPNIEKNSSSNEIWKFLQKVEHYINRYGKESILEYIPEDKMSFLRKELERRQIQEKENISIPITDTNRLEEKLVNSKQNILKRQEELRRDNIIDGEVR